jgi:hypothetical protein
VGISETRKACYLDVTINSNCPMIIYCSKKLETFLGKMTAAGQITANSSFGDWNGHLFTLNRKRCLIFMNNKTCYSVLMKNVLKAGTWNFGQVFKERLIRQLDHDLKINESQQVKLRKEFSEVTLVKSNNDKKIIGTINHHIENLKYNSYGVGVENWDEVNVTGVLNDYLVSTKITIGIKRNGDYFRPIELMQDLIK